jgi:hypothetical protein
MVLIGEISEVAMPPRSLMRSFYSCSKCNYLLQHQFKEEYVVSHNDISI